MRRATTAPAKAEPTWGPGSLSLMELPGGAPAVRDRPDRDLLVPHPGPRPRLRRRAPRERSPTRRDPPDPPDRRRRHHRPGEPPARHRLDRPLDRCCRVAWRRAGAGDRRQAEAFARGARYSPSPVSANSADAERTRASASSPRTGSTRSAARTRCTPSSTGSTVPSASSPISATGKGRRNTHDLASVFGRAEDAHAKCHFDTGLRMDADDYGRCLAAAADAGYDRPLYADLREPGRRRVGSTPHRAGLRAGPISPRPLPERRFRELDAVRPSTAPPRPARDQGRRTQRSRPSAGRAA